MYTRGGNSTPAVITRDIHIPNVDFRFSFKDVSYNTSEKKLNRVIGLDNGLAIKQRY